MSIISAPRLDRAAGSERTVVRRPARPHHEKVLHPERFEGPLPRRREHITLIRWRRGGGGDWSYECVAAQFLSAAAGRWTVTIGEIEHEYDMTDWSVCAN
jgi:hypothetical protein